MGAVMRRSGELVHWNDARGFGFIRDGVGARHFVHIKSIRRTVVRPEAGLRATFVPDVDAEGRSVATAVVLFGIETTPTRVARTTERRGQPNPAPLRLAAAAAIVVTAGSAVLLDRASVWLLVGYLAIGVISIWRYWADKAKAEAQEWRVSEAELHGLDLVGGIAGGLVAQALLHHKTRKAGFAAITWSIAAAHLVVLGAVATGLIDIPAAIGALLAAVRP